MNELFEGFFIFFILFAILFFNFLTLRRFYYLYKGYSKEISEFVRENELKLIDIKRPNSSDWHVSPFNTKDTNIIELALPFSIKNHYYFVTEDKNNVVNEYWFRNRVPFFGKVKKEFKIAKTKRTEKEYLSNFNKELCPACSSKIKVSDKECPDCGLVIS